MKKAIIDMTLDELRQRQQALGLQVESLNAERYEIAARIAHLESDEQARAILDGLSEGQRAALSAALAKGEV